MAVKRHQVIFSDGLPFALRGENLFVHHGDALEFLTRMPDAGVDAVVTDPPYALSFMSKDWDANHPDPVIWKECLRVLKPGGHLLSFGGTRTFHRLACDIEDAGLEIRDSISWLYGSGFPKSQNVALAIDKQAGAIGHRGSAINLAGKGDREDINTAVSVKAGTLQPGYNDPVTDAAKQWKGWGTALKPAWEPIIVARKPFKGTVANNVLTHGTGALNIDACRVEAGQDYRDKCASVVGLDSNRNGAAYGEWTGVREDSASPAGRWPPNVLLDESQAEVLDEQSGYSHAGQFREGVARPRPRQGGVEIGEGQKNFGTANAPDNYGDSGGASRFFPTFKYQAKAPARERPKYWHKSCNCETVKPCPSPPRGTTESSSTGDKSWNTSMSGNRPMDGEFHQDTTFTTETTTSSTTPSTTCNSLPSSNTSESTQDANLEMASGGNPAPSAEASNLFPRTIGTSVQRDGRSMVAADPATLNGWSETSVCANCGEPSKRESHATVKPLELMRWLVRLVTPPGGVVLDPFAGSGTTGQAVLLEDAVAVLCEKEQTYIPLIAERLKEWIHEPEEQHMAIDVTFSNGLPLGEHASFTHDDRQWIAVPVDKYTQIVTVTDRLLGVLAHARAQLTTWIGVEPWVAPRVVPVLATLSRGDDAAVEKIEAQTS